jgi:hypothetical protein
MLSALTTLIITHPFDIIRLRLLNDLARPDEKIIYNGFFDCAKKILKNENVKGFYKGLPISIIGIVPYFGISFGIYDSIKY